MKCDSPCAQCQDASVLFVAARPSADFNCWRTSVRLRFSLQPVSALETPCTLLETVIKQFQSWWKNTSETYPVIRSESFCFSISLVIQSCHTMLCWSNIVSGARIHSFGFPCFGMVSGPTIWPFQRLQRHSITKEVAQSQEVRAVTPERMTWWLGGLSAKGTLK